MEKLISDSGQIKVVANIVQSSSKIFSLGYFKSVHLFYVHISIFSALLSTSIYLPCPGEKCFLLQNIVQHCAEISPGCSWMYSAPHVVHLLSASSPCLLFRFIPIVLCIWGGSILCASWGTPSPGDDGSAGQAITRELMLCGDGGDPGGAELPQDGCVWWCGCSHGTTASAAGWLWWALASVPQAGKTAESSESSWRDEAQCLKCTVKSFSQGCCPQCHCLFVSVTYVNNSGWCEEKVNLLLPFCSRHIFVSTSPPVTVCLPPTLNLPSCISHLFVPTSPSFPAYLSTLTGYGTSTLRTCL